MAIIKFNDDYKETTTEINGSTFEVIELDHHILKARRNELKLTQQQVANEAEIQLRQYQRLESGERTMASASLRIGLSICYVLKLDPYRFYPTIIYHNTEKK